MTIVTVPLQALHDRLDRLTDRLKARFEEFETRMGKLEAGMRGLGEMASKLGELGTRVEEALPAPEAMADMESRVGALEKPAPLAPDEGLRLTEVTVGDGNREVGPTVPEVEKMFRCLSCGQQSSQTKTDHPAFESWKCKYCGGTTYHAGKRTE